MTVSSQTIPTPSASDRIPPGNRPRAIVIGGSMAGLFVALLLRRAGWDADIFERMGSELSSRGAGIVTHAELFDVLQHAGINTDEARVGVRVEGRRVFARDGTVSGSHPLEQVLTSWGHLYGLLRQAMPAAHYHHGRTLIRISETATAVTAHFSDGSIETGDLLVGCDGIFSTVRAQLAPQSTPAYAGYFAWRGLVDESDLTPETRAALCDHFAFSLPPGEQMLGYPVAGANEALDRGQRRFNFVWYRPAPVDGVLKDLLTDSDGISHALSIPPNKIRPQVLDQMRADARDLLAPQFAEVVTRTHQPFIQVIQDLETPRMQLSPRTVILGDAAFVARPHVGMGVTKAAGDAAALVRALAQPAATLPHALAAFAQAREPFGAAVVTRARQLGAYMQAQLLTQEERDMAERHRHPEAIMAETAVA